MPVVAKLVTSDALKAHIFDQSDGTFLQTLPDLVRPLTEGALFQYLHAATGSIEAVSALRN